MDEHSESTHLATIAELRSELATRNAEILEKQLELESTTTSLRTVISHKNKKIRELEEQLARLKEDNQETTDNAISNEMKEMRLMLASMDKTLKTNTRVLTVKNDVGELLPFLEKVQRSMETSTCGTIRARFTEISKLSEVRVYSESTRVAGLEWAIYINTHEEENVKYLSVYLEMITKPIPRSWACPVVFTTKLIRQHSMGQPYFSDSNGVVTFSAARPGDLYWGRVRHIEFEELLNPTNEYVKKDAILVELDFTVYPTKLI